MIFEHEIPNGSRLYFGNKANAKRELEYKASGYLLDNGFEEIITPMFSYSQYQSIDDEKELITLKDDTNHTLAIRADSTLDVVRIITKRLGRTTEHKKWFYIQPVFSYPSVETYQIGAEWIGYDNISDVINLNSNLLSSLDVDAMVQISNIKIALIISQKFNIDINLFKNGEIGTLFSLNIDWLTKLIEVQKVVDLENIIDILPDVLKSEAEKLISIANEVQY
ncbi:MAG: ATP phosphoribosyltransferase regulatory subunit, partial [Campylobacterota bacterium]|nr:ATP phosphoribosyltransferase regulatory subunit [Campylobacterota bacterium]